MLLWRWKNTCNPLCVWIWLTKSKLPRTPASQIATCKWLEQCFFKSVARAYLLVHKVDVSQANTIGPQGLLWMWLKALHKGASNLDVINMFFFFLYGSFEYWTDFHSMLVCLLRSVCTSTTEQDECALSDCCLPSLTCFSEHCCKIWDWVVVDQRLMVLHLFLFVPLQPQNGTLKSFISWLTLHCPSKHLIVCCVHWPLLTLDMPSKKIITRRNQRQEEDVKFSLSAGLWTHHCFPPTNRTYQLYFLLCISHDALRGRWFYSLGK